MNPPPHLQSPPISRHGRRGHRRRLAQPGHLAAAGRSRSGENEHFWYRLAPEGPYIDSQRDNKAFGFGDGKIFLSEDNGQTWAHSAAFADAENISFSCILKNGNILFATREKLFLSTDNLKTHRADHRQRSRRQRLPAAHAAEIRISPAGISIRSTAFTPGTSTARKCWCGETTAMCSAGRCR